MPTDKAMSFWGFLDDDDDNAGAAPDMEEFPYLAAGPGALTASLEPVRRAVLLCQRPGVFSRGPVAVN